MDPRCAAGGGCPMHLQDELSDLGIDRRPARPLRSALAAPVETEALAVPVDDGLRLDDHEGFTPSGPQAREPRPEDPVGDSQGDPLSAALAIEDE